MKFKLDENLGPTIKQIFQGAGYDVHTIFEQNMLGKQDIYIYEHCLREGYCLVSLDLDFSDIVRFPPVNTHGIVILRIPKRQSYELIQKLAQQFLLSLDDNQKYLRGSLWIVEPGRIRIRQMDKDVGENE